MTIPPLLILAFGIATVVGLILFLRLNAFLALIISALLVSLMAPGPIEEKASRVALAFGQAAGGIGIVIALAAIIGTCMMDSGAADRIVRAFVRWLGMERASVALMGSGYVLAVPVFFDTVFYLLVPLGRSLYRQTGKHYLKYLMAIGTGGVITHTLVPPTPGPLAVAENLGIDLGWLIMVGAILALPSAVVGLAFGAWIDRIMPIPMRPIAGQEEEPEPLEDHELPSLFVSTLPVILPVLLISTNTILRTLAGDSVAGEPATGLRQAADVAALLGNANVALLLATVVAMWVYVRQRKPSVEQVSKMVENSLMSAGVIILITAAGGAFGEMLKAAQLGPAIEAFFGSEAEAGGGVSGLWLLVLGFAISAVLKIAQGSSTVAMITASGMMAAMVPSASLLGFHPVYLATAIGSGSLVGSWMNDSGFWIVARMGGLTEAEALKSWTPLLVVMGFTGLLSTIAMATILPLV